LTRLDVIQIKVGPMDNFAYLLVDRTSKEAIVVDSGWETNPILKAVQAKGAIVKYVVATHEHFDHTSTIADLAKQLNSKVVAHSASPIEHDISVDDGDELVIGRSKVRVVHTPGHTADSICLYDGENVFTGDTLFVDTIGKFDDSNADDMYHSLHDVLMKLPDSTMVYSGHDYGEVPFRTLGEEKADNVFLRAKSLSEFVSTSG